MHPPGLLAATARRWQRTLSKRRKSASRRRKRGSQGFYLRGDLGYAGWTREGDPSLASVRRRYGGTMTRPFDDARFGKPFSGALGVGYQFNDMFRADLTADYFEGQIRWDGRERTFPARGEAAGTSCAGSMTADYKALGLMANGYVDLAHGGRLHALCRRRPRRNPAALERCLADGPACVARRGRLLRCRLRSQSFDGDSSWRFTYALMAGVSYDMTRPAEARRRLPLFADRRRRHVRRQRYRRSRRRPRPPRGSRRPAVVAVVANGRPPRRVPASKIFSEATQVR